jgi:hypothetical protein
VTFDFDDFHESNHKLERLHELKEINPEFRCTMFAVPALGSAGFWGGLPNWIELAVHGWAHGSVYECSRWSYGRMEALLDNPIVQEFFVHGFKAPGWQISDDCYRVLLDRGWWVADQHLEDERRPVGLRTYFYEDGHWHGHIQDVCGNGIEETWPQLKEAVLTAHSFEFASENAS